MNKTELFLLSHKHQTFKELVQTLLLFVLSISINGGPVLLFSSHWVRGGLHRGQLSLSDVSVQILVGTT